MLFKYLAHLLLDIGDDLNMGTALDRKCPPLGDERLVSQEFLSEAEAVEAWRNNQLVWETPPKF